MAGRVFISCGQATRQERLVADSLQQWFKERGFLPYVAIQAQSLEDVDSIVEELRRSDFYVFVDLRRERLPRGGRLFGLCDSRRWRGSLFTHQELAIGKVLRFAKVLFLQQEGAKLEGLLRYMCSNAATFEKTGEILSMVEKLVDERGWTPSYSRHLEIGDSHWTPSLPYVDHTGIKKVRVFELDIHNRRNDIPALNAVTRLARLTSSDGQAFSGIDTSQLKVVGHQGYSHAIWPERRAAWDLLAVHVDQPALISLNSALDVIPRTPLISEAGEYLLTYEVFAVNFPALTFNLKVRVEDDSSATSVSVDSEIE